MAYEKTTWVDHVLDGEGKVVQQGTPVNASNLNKIEEGIQNSVSKDGVDTITGGVKFKNPTKKCGGRVIADDGGTVLSAEENVVDENGDSLILELRSPSKSDVETMLQLRRTVNGETEEFNVIHSGNKNSIKPEDIGGAPSKHKHDASDINEGTLGSERLPTVPIAKGGTGATDAKEAFKKLANNGAIISLDNQFTRYTKDIEENENSFNAWLDGVMEQMPALSSVSIVFRCSPVLGGSTYYGVLNKHTQEFATLVASTYENDKTGYIHKVKSTTWKNAKYLYQEISRTDIGAAPAGFGLGATGAVLNSSNDLNDVQKNGWYAWNSDRPQNAPDETGLCAMLVIAMSEGNVTQIVHSYREGKNVTIERRKASFVWSPWEYTSKRYGTEDLEAGVTPLHNGELYFVYE